MSRPNILILMTDHQRADTVLPEHPAITPHMDGFAAQGVTFTSSFCGTPHCCPARASFFSGLYPSRHGIWNNVFNEQALGTGLKEGVRLWSEDLAEAGYRMLYSGKWHVTGEELPSDRGWEEIGATSALGTHHGPTWESFRKAAEAPEPTERGEGEILRPGWGTVRLYGTSERNGHDEAALSEAIQVLPELAAGDAPWCLYVGFIAPHDPYNVPQRYLDMYDVDDVPLPASYADHMRDKPGLYQRMRDQIFDQLSEREVREAIRHFWAYCTYIDDLFGQLLSVLDETGEADDTVVIFCSDHGDYCGEHGLFAKGIPCFNGAYHVPFVVRWPNGIADPGRRVDEFVMLSDMAPTAQELAGVPVDTSLTGASLVPFLRGETPADWRDEMHTQCDGTEIFFTQRSVTTKEYKYVYNASDRDELYDLRTDPDEMVNVFTDPAYADVIREMCGRMWRFMEKEQDGAFMSYITISLAPWGPADAFRERE